MAVTKKYLYKKYEQSQPSSAKSMVALKNAQVRLKEVNDKIPALQTDFAAVDQSMKNATVGSPAFTSSQSTREKVKAELDRLISMRNSFEEQINNLGGDDLAFLESLIKQFPVCHTATVQKVSAVEKSIENADVRLSTLQQMWNFDVSANKQHS